MAFYSFPAEVMKEKCGKHPEATWQGPQASHVQTSFGEELGSMGAGNRRGWTRRRKGQSEGGAVRGTKRRCGAHTARRTLGPSCRLHGHSPKPFSIVQTVRGKCGVHVLFLLLPQTREPWQRCWGRDVLVQIRGADQTMVTTGMNQL